VIFELETLILLHRLDGWTTPAELLGMLPRRFVAMEEKMHCMIVCDLRLVGRHWEIIFVAISRRIAMMQRGLLGMSRSGGMLLRTAEFGCHGDRVVRMSREETTHKSFPWVATVLYSTLTQLPQFDPKDIFRSVP
jgi:hypothetical protein